MISAPPTTSEWPPRYFVAECVTKSAPNPMGCCRYGEANVLSTTSQAPASWVILATASRSTTRRSGLVGVSTQTTRVSSRTAFFTASRSVVSTTSYSSPMAGANTRATSR